jgi:hypothetical protein
MSHCFHCPRVNEPCDGEKFRRLCELVDPNHTRFDARYRNYLNPNATPIVTEPIISNNQHIIITGHAGTLHKIPVAESVQLSKDINACPHRIKDASCGCGKSLCLAGKQGVIDPRKTDGSTLVTFLDCSICLRPDNADIKAMRDGPVPA